jgi:hypothetical protein
LNCVISAWDIFASGSDFGLRWYTDYGKRDEHVVMRKPTALALLYNVGELQLMIYWVQCALWLRLWLCSHTSSNWIFYVISAVTLMLCQTHCRSDL